MTDDEPIMLPAGYFLDLISHPGLVVLRRRDGAFVAAYSSLRFRMEEAKEAAVGDRREDLGR